MSCAMADSITQNWRDKELSGFTFSSYHVPWQVSQHFALISSVTRTFFLFFFVRIVLHHPATLVGSSSNEQTVAQPFWEKLNCGNSAFSFK